MPPLVDGDVVDFDPTFGQDFFDVVIRQSLATARANSQQPTSADDDD